ncbi:MAG: cyclic pyranopterin monophosphate synthase MoaC [Oscillospiraceae bacterium]|nr:cyclic pyranopterin monophosphate synthase MoaC [Oscillospiraceae bacterium]
MENKFNHFDPDGNAVMADISEKKPTRRVAVASGEIKVGREVMQTIADKTNKKGDVLGTARIAGITATKRTSDLIPMCHPLMLTKCSVDFEVFEPEFKIRAVCTVKTEGKTGVEMEALTGVSVSLLTIYDMCKAVDKRMVISDIRLVSKSGGKSGDFFFAEEPSRKECE